MSMYYFEPVNVNQWNMFEKVKNIGHVEPFLATSSMNIGDTMLLHVGSQNKKYESGIYAVGTIVKAPYILENSPQDYCNNKLTVNVRIDKINYSYPYITHEECKAFINQFRTAHKISEEHYALIENRIYENGESQLGSMYVGITDTNWMKFIKEQKDNIDRYINFWTPGTKTFKAIQPGELFLFKLHAKKAKGENGEIVGGAYFDGFEQMSVSEAWNRFGYGNGTTSQFELKSAIDEYRVRNNMDRNADIGCIVLRDPFFFEEDKWIESPADWGKSIVSGKKYDISGGIGYELYQQVSAMMNDNVDEIIISDIEADADKLQILGKERETFIKARVNQSVFRERLLNKYDCCCLCKVSNPKFLIASHIKPWADSENDEKLDADNGFLLCPNHDALFDSGYISFDENGAILISEELGQVDVIFMNIDKNMKISLSSKNKKYLEYHRNNIFKK